MLCTEKARDADSILVQNPREISHLKEAHTDGSIIVKWILKQQCGRTRAVMTWLMIGASGRLL